MTKALPDTARAAALPALLAQGWQMEQGRDAITIALKFNSFSMAFAAMTRIALRAEAMDHHPEWRNVYNRLTITLTTHSAGGLSELDMTLAANINDIAADMGASVIR